MCDFSANALALYRPCPNPSPRDTDSSAFDPSPSAQALRLLLTSNRPGSTNTLTLGMGDNFAMNYLSRVMVIEEEDDQAKKRLRYIPKDELRYDGIEKGWRDVEDLRRRVSDPKDSHHGAALSLLSRLIHDIQTEIDGDNVADFFVNAQYDALVPGKHDFFYGPERLREIARYLETKGVRMLGTNLVVRTTDLEPVPVLHERFRQKRRNYWTVDHDSEDEPIKVNPLSWKLPKHVTPWMREFRLENARKGGTWKIDRTSARIYALGSKLDQVANCAAELTIDQPKRQVFIAERKTLDDASGSSEVNFYIPGGQTLNAGESYAVCVDRAGATKPFCRVFHVEAPLLEAPPFSISNRRPYLVHQGPTRTTAVLGVVALGMEKQIGDLRSSWVRLKAGGDLTQKRPVDKNTLTQVETMDPISSIIQVVEFCLRLGDCDSDTRFVVMAQMTPPAALLLARGLDERGIPIAVVLSQADAQYSSDSNIIFPSEHPTPVLTPGELNKRPGEDDHAPQAQIHVADLVGQASAPEVRIRSQRRACEACDESSWDRTGGSEATESFEKLLSSAWANLMTRLPGASADSGQPTSRHLQVLALHSARQALKTDVAIMQDRDFFEDGYETEISRAPSGAYYSHEKFESMLERIFWKGDFIVRRTITGAALKQALAESQRIALAQQNPYEYQAESDRHLVYLGLSREPEGLKQWFVNGRPLEDKTLYSVALTDFLAFGDTGYPQLQKAAVPPGRRLARSEGLLRFSDQIHFEVCRLAQEESPTITSGLCRPASASGQPLPPSRRPPVDHFHLSSLSPPPPGPAADVPAQALQALRESYDRFPDFESSEERLSHFRPYSQLIIDKGEFAFATYANGAREQNELSNRFPGVAAPAVTRRPSWMLAPAVQVEFRRIHARSRSFIRSEVGFSEQRTLRDEAIPEFDGSGEDRFITNLGANVASLEFGFRRPFAGVNRRTGSIQWIASFDLSTQAKSPRRNLTFDLAAETETPTLPPVPEGEASEHDVPREGTLSLDARLPRTIRNLPKVGVRWDGRQSWLEAGHFRGWVTRPRTFSLVGKDVISVGAPCLPTQEVEGEIQVVDACLRRNFVLKRAAPDARPAFSRETLSETGYFFDGNLRLTLPESWVLRQLVVEQRFQWFHRRALGRDNAADTRFLETLSIGPTIPIYQSLSLKPEYQITLFRNRVLGKTLFGQSFQWTLDYRFDWRIGSHSAQVLKYGRP